MPEQNTKSQANLSTISILSIGGVAVLILGSYFLFNGGENPVGIIIGLLFLFFGIYCVWWVLNFDHLHVTKYTLIIISITGRIKRKICLKSISAYTVKSKENIGRSLKWEDLVLIGDNFNYKISSTSYKNYRELKKVLSKSIKRRKKL